MTDQRDPILESVFAAADLEATDEAFTRRVLSGIDATARWAFVGRLAIGLGLAACAAMFAPALQDAAGALNASLQAPLFDLAGASPNALLSPLNSAASLLAVAIIGLMIFVRSLVVWLFA